MLLEISRPSAWLSVKRQGRGEVIWCLLCGLCLSTDTYKEKLMKSVRENIFIEVLEKRLLSFLHSQNTGKFYLKTNMLTKLKVDYRQSFKIDFQNYIIPPPLNSMGCDN